MNENRKVPKLRFPGFTGDWEQRKVKDICSISTGKSNTQDKVDDGIYPFYVRSPIIERSNKYLYDEEAVLTVGDGVGTGKVFHYVNGKYDLHQRVYRLFDFSDDIDAKYFYQWFSDKFYSRVMSMTAKTSVDSVRLEMIAEMDMVAPSIEEQKCISRLLNGIDNLITLHQRKLELIKEYKAGMLQKMFPKNGQKSPEIRFPGFTDDWEQRKLNDICFFEKGRGLNRNDLDENGQYPCILYGQLFTEYGMFIDEIISRTNKIDDSYKYSQKGDILIPRCDTTPDGLGRASSLDLSGVILGFDINILKIKDRKAFDSGFVSVSLNYHKKELLSKVVGTTVRHLENKELQDVIIEYPNDIKEQIKIRDTFFELERLITLHQRKLDLLKEYKKGLLQQMFI